MCGACGELAALINGTDWIHKITGREECGSVGLRKWIAPYLRRDSDTGQAANSQQDRQPKSHPPMITELRHDLGYLRRHLNHMFSLTEETERPDLRGTLLDDLREIRGLL